MITKPDFTPGYISEFDLYFFSCRCCYNKLFTLLYIEPTISFLIGQKRTVNFQNQRLGRHLAADFTIIMSTTLKVTGNHVMYDRGA